MMNKDHLKESVTNEVDRLLSRLVVISDSIADNPELGSEEYKSSKLLMDELEKHGFEVERGILGMDTAFRAVYEGKAQGPRFAFITEYDALPGIGHACGHNIIGTAGVGAGIAVSKLMKDISGEVIVLGAPAEEGHGPSAGSKKRMVEAGVFDDIDIAVQLHPTPGKSEVSYSVLATAGTTITFLGKPAHAAASPHEGLNALNAAVLTFMAVQANRQQLRRDANPVIHGIITEGGIVSNIIPDRAVLKYGVRSSDDDYVPELIKIVENSAKGAAIATGCELKTEKRAGMRSNLRNKPLESLLYDILRELGEDVEELAISAARIPQASTDFAEVTHALPALQIKIHIAPEGIAWHTPEFAEAAKSEAGHKGLEIGAKALAITAVEIFSDPDLLNKIKEAHRNVGK